MLVKSSVKTRRVIETRLLATAVLSAACVTPGSGGVSEPKSPPPSELGICIATEGPNIIDVGFADDCPHWRGRDDPDEREVWRRLELGVFALGGDYDAFLAATEQHISQGAAATDALATVWQKRPALATMLERSRCFSRPGSRCSIPTLTVTDEQMLQAVAAHLWPAIGPDNTPVLMACTGTNGLEALPEGTPDEMIAIARVAAMVSPEIEEVAREMYESGDATDGLTTVADAPAEVRLRWSLSRLQASSGVAKGICEVVNELRWWVDLRVPMCGAGRLQ